MTERNLLLPPLPRGHSWHHPHSGQAGGPLQRSRTLQKCPTPCPGTCPADAQGSHTFPRKPSLSTAGTAPLLSSSSFFPEHCSALVCGAGGEGTGPGTLGPQAGESLCMTIMLSPCPPFLSLQTTSGGLNSSSLAPSPKALDSAAPVSSVLLGMAAPLPASGHQAPRWHSACPASSCGRLLPDCLL